MLTSSTTLHGRFRPLGAAAAFQAGIRSNRTTSTRAFVVLTTRFRTWRRGFDLGGSSESSVHRDDHMLAWHACDITDFHTAS
jgi:hypothetical protein